MNSNMNSNVSYGNRLNVLGLLSTTLVDRLVESSIACLRECFAQILETAKKEEFEYPWRADVTGGQGDVFSYEMTADGQVREINPNLVPLGMVMPITVNLADARGRGILFSIGTPQLAKLIRRRASDEPQAQNRQAVR